MKFHQFDSNWPSMVHLSPTPTVVWLENAGLGWPPEVRQPVKALVTVR
jgi:hypothetical protein